MSILFQIIVLILCYLMFKVNRVHKLAILLFCTICLDAVVVSFIPFGGAKYLLSFCFILSERVHIRKNVKQIKGTILYPLLILVSLSFVLLAISSPHYRTFSQLIKLFITELLVNYFVIFYAFFSCKEVSELKSVLKICFWGLFVLTFFAVLNYITGSSLFINSVYVLPETYDLGGLSVGDKYMFADRFRVQAMFYNPFNYGYICIVLLLFFIYGYGKKIVKKRFFYIALLCCIFGIFSCGCRTVLLCAIVGFCVYLITGYYLKTVVRNVVITVLIFITSYIFIPFVQDRVDQMTTMFEQKSSYSGSSIDMRLLQYTAVMKHVGSNVLFGRGKDYFYIDMGWGKGKQMLVDVDLHGLEGVLMNYMLERGIFGVLFYFFFYGFLFFFAYWYRKYDKLTSAFCLAVLSSYFTFANMTGELNSVYSTLLIVGINVKILYEMRYKFTPPRWLINVKYHFQLLMLHKELKYHFQLLMLHKELKTCVA